MSRTTSLAGPAVVAAAALLVAGCGGAPSPRRTVTQVVVVPTESTAAAAPAQPAPAQPPQAAPAQPAAPVAPRSGSAGGPLPGGSQGSSGKTSAGACADAPSSYGEIGIGARGADVAVAQCLLNRNGAGIAVDGVFGTQTANALQKVMLARTGQGIQEPYISSYEWQVLVTTGDTPRLTKGSSGAAVRRLQRGLSLAVRPIVVDGSFGNQTLAAVKEYQSQVGLTVDGVVGPQTWGALKSGNRLGD